MADLRLIEFRRKWERRFAVIGLDAVRAAAADQAIGIFAPHVRCQIVKAYLVLGADIALEDATHDGLDFYLYDRKAAGTGDLGACTTGITIAGGYTVTGVTGATFVTDELHAGDIIAITSAGDATIDGSYTVVSIESETALTVSAPFPSAQVDLVIARSGQIGVAITNTAALVDDIKHDFEADGYILAEDSVIVVELDWTDAAGGGPDPIIGPTLCVEYIPLPAV